MEMMQGVVLQIHRSGLGEILRLGSHPGGRAAASRPHDGQWRKERKTRIRPNLDSSVSDGEGQRLSGAPTLMSFLLILETKDSGSLSSTTGGPSDDATVNPYILYSS